MTRRELVTNAAALVGSGLLLNKATAAEDPQNNIAGTYTLYDSNRGTAQTGLPLNQLGALVQTMGYSEFVVGTPA